jgi:peptide/nickel transport system substrate-binding protein
MRISRRSLIAGAAAAPLLGAVARAAPPAGNLRFGLSSFPPNLLPWQNVGTAATTVKFAMFRGLLGYGPDGQLRGEIAESYDREGDTGWVFHLRDALFNDGSPVTADDVKWTIEQVAGEKSTAYLRNEMRQIVKIETPDARTVRLTTSQPAVTLPLWMASCYMPVVKRDSVKPGAVATGCGPFELQSQERGTSIVVGAFEKFYRPNLPKLASVTFTAYADENLRVSALHAGDVDLIEFLPWPAMQGVEDDPRLRLDNSSGGLFMYLQFNAKIKPFDDPRVRQAIAMAVRREDIVKVAFFGRGQPLEGLPLPPDSPYTDQAMAHGWTYAPEKAKALLKEAGVGDGFSCKLLSTAQYGMHKDTAVLVQRNLADIGIAVELVLPDWPTRVAMGDRGQYELAVDGSTLDYNDPDALSQLIDSSLPPYNTRSFGLNTPELDRLLAEGRAEFDPVKRKRIYERVQEIGMDQVPVVGLCWRVQGYGLSRQVGGFKNLPGSLTIYSGSTLEQTTLA